MRLRCTNHGANHGNGVRPFKDHCDDWTRRDEFHKPFEEGAGCVHGVMRLSKLWADRRDLKGDDLKAALFESRNDATRQLALNAVWFDEDKGALAAAHSGRLADIVGARFLVARRWPCP